MKSLLRITNGDITKNIASGDDMRLMGYQPKVAPVSSPAIDDNPISFAFVGNAAANKDNLHTINLLFEQARNYKKTRTGPRVYLEYDPDSSGTYYRSQISDGQLDISPDSAVGSQLESPYLYAILTITREPAWEGPDTQVPLSNTSASLDTAGITVTDSSHQIVPTTLIGWDDGSIIAFDDGSEIAWGDPVTGNENFVDIAGGDVIGDLPAQIRIEIENNTSGSAANKEFYLFHNVYSHPLDFNHMLEAEDADGDTVTTGSDANCQGGSKATLAWTATTETLIATWSLSSALATFAAGGRFAALARWKGAFPYTDTFLRLRLLTANDDVLWSGDLTLIKSARELAFLDVLRLPPYLENQPDMLDIKLALYGYRNHSGTHSIVLDYLQLSPISGDGGWKNFLSVDQGIAYQEKLVHDAVNGFNYRVDTSGRKISEFTAIGGPILLVPGQNQRIYINQCDKDGAAKIDQQWIVKLYYRPRRSSL